MGNQQGESVNILLNFTQFLRPALSTVSRYSLLIPAIFASVLRSPCVEVSALSMFSPMPDARQNLCGITAINQAIILAHRDVQHPVQAIFDGPVLTRTARANSSCTNALELMK